MCNHSVICVVWVGASVGILVGSSCVIMLTCTLGSELHGVVYGDIGHERELFFSSVSTISELGGYGVNNIISNSKANGDNNTHFFNS